MRLYSTYKAYISRSNKIILNSLTIVFAVISILFARDESMLILPFTVCTMAYVAVAGVMDFFQFGGILSKKGNIPESVLCAFKGKELLVKAVTSDTMAHFIRMFVILIPTLIFADEITCQRIFLTTAALFGSYLALTLMQLVTRLLCVTFQISMLIASLIMIPLSVIVIIPSVAFMFAEGDLTFFMLIISSVFALIGIGISVLHAHLAGKTYVYKLADLH